MSAYIIYESWRKYIKTVYVCISICRQKTYGSVHIILEFLEMRFYHLEQNVPLELAAVMKILSKSVLSHVAETSHMYLLNPWDVASLAEQSNF